MAATVSSPWSKPGAWALDAEEHEDELQQQHDERQQQKASEIADFPSLAAAAATKTKKKSKGQTLSLAEFNSGKVAQPTQPKGLTHEDLLVLPTGPRQRSAEELDKSRLGGGFRNYGSGSRYGSNGSSGEENSRWGGGSRGSGRDAGRESQPSRADEIDNWAAAKKPVSSIREKGGFFESHSKADESDSWVSNKTPPATAETRSKFGFSGGFERKSSFDSLSRERDRDGDNWGRKREQTGGGERPRLVLQPRTVPVSADGPAVAKPKGANPFGEARPREEVLAEKGKDWKEIDEKLEAVKIKEERPEGFERGRRGFGNGRAVDTRSWRKNDNNDPNSAEVVTRQRCKCSITHTDLIETTSLYCLVVSCLVVVSDLHTSSFMDWSLKFPYIAFLILAAAINGVLAETMVTGTVFCDQCKDGQRSLFDYPISGIKVRVTCANDNGQTTMSREETTNWFGSYAMRFDGSPNLSNCHAQVSGSGQGSTTCGTAAGPAQNLRLIFRMFNMAIYFVDSLLTQPDRPMSFCPRSVNPVSPPSTSTRPASPVTPANPVSSPNTPKNPPTPDTPPRSPPTFRLPPLPSLPPLPPLPPMPPMPFAEASACPHQSWTMPENKCYWRELNPDTKVAAIFGPLAARRYGTNMTLWQGLQGRGDPHRTLLREATTALLNSYNSLQFSYNSVGVVTHTNQALMGSNRSVLLTALRFMRANSGSGNVSCKFTACK